MKIKIDTRTLSIVGFALMALGLIVPFLRTPMGSFSLMFRMGAMGELGAFTYFLAFHAMIATGFVAFVVFARQKKLMFWAAIAAGATFLILLIGFFVVKGISIGLSGGYYGGGLFRMGLAPWLYFFAGGVLFMVSRGLYLTVEKENEQM